MNELSFAYWLQGYFELTDSGQPLSAQQVQIIKDHLELVFNKVTPTYKKLSEFVEGEPVESGNRLRSIEYCGQSPYDSVKMSTPIPGDGYGVDLGYGYTNTYKGLPGIFRPKTLEDVEWENRPGVNVNTVISHTC